MTGQVRILASFDDEEQCAEAIERVRHLKLGTVQAFAPFPSERLSEAMGPKPSPVRAWVLAGGISGALSGFALTVGTSYTYPHYVGGKSLSSLPPYVIIAFELLILFGSLLGLAGFLLHGRFPRFESVPNYLPRFASDRFGVVVSCEPAQAERAEAMLIEGGAEEVHRESL